MKKVSTRIGTITASDEVLDWLSVLLEDAVRYNENKGCLMWQRSLARCLMHCLMPCSKR